MGIKANFTLSDIRKRFGRVTVEVDKAIIATLAFLGEQCVIQARLLNTYQDQTGNLRSSVGYVILRNGNLIKNSFTGVKAGGRKQGQQVARALASEYSTGYVLIVVAGMNYAAAVESRGYDVLTTSELYAERQLPELMRQLKRQINALPL